MSKQLIAHEQFTSIQEAQSGISKLLKKADKEGFFYRVLRNNKPLGVLVPGRVWDSLLEDLEALSSPGYLERIQKARETQEQHSSTQVKRELGL